MSIHPSNRRSAPTAKRGSSDARAPRATPILVACLLLALAACGRDQEARSPGASGPAPGQAPAAAPATASEAVQLEDVIETDPRYIIGISYPRGIDRYPGLAAVLKRYADAARAEVLSAVEDVDPASLTSPYDLSLAFSMPVETPRVVAVAADGSAYTGGAHGNPLVARFVWLPTAGQLLTADQLIPEAGGWQDVSAYVREQLHSALSQRVDADDLAPVEREQVMRSAIRMIDEGSDPEPGNFAQFEPVPGADGRLRALRFVFPPYQVGPYSDGVQTVEVPASVLLPHVAPQYRDLFAAA